MAKWVCTRCNVTGDDFDHPFDQHTCKGMRAITELSYELLRQVCEGKLSEAQAWAIHDK